MRLEDHLSYEALEFWFADNGENLERDISEVHVICILYCKDYQIDFSVDVFGANGTKGLPVYSEVIPIESDKVFPGQMVSPLFVAEIFEERVLRLFSEKGLQIHWNPGCSSMAEINPLNPDPSMELPPEEDHGL
ncbi:hypothetical protein [Desulfobacula sp.]|uniref:hypothetical protein n=1 Tax=Desulfobacula sp. TaxID=2593537 RepID=UPI001EC3AFAB|nr:hypothetical protein [Desulfobacula sp.]